MPKTIEQIAQATGYSITTVKLVINGQADKYRISQDAQKKVTDYIATHGYAINHAARSLKLKRSDTIGFIAPDLANPFFARLMAELELHCERHGLVLLTASSHENQERETRVIRNMLARGVDGIVSAPCQPTPIPQLCHRKKRTPAVLVDRDYPQAHYPTVTSDNQHSGLLLARAMLEQAQAPVYFLCGHSDSPSIQARIASFIEANRAHGHDSGHDYLLTAGEDSAAAGQALMQALLDRQSMPPKAFMCSSLLILEGALQQLKTSTGKIDPTILIGTFDDHAMLDLLPNCVLSIRQDEATLASITFARLLEQIQHGETACMHNTVPCQLIRRN